MREFVWFATDDRPSDAFGPGFIGQSCSWGELGRRELAYRGLGGFGGVRNIWPFLVQRSMLNVANGGGKTILSG